jgi:hypothetical protein
MDDDVTLYDTEAAVCVVHSRFVPCRSCDEPSPANWSSDPADVERVRRYQQDGQRRHLLEHGNSWLVNVHDPGKCAGSHCTIHNRSDHQLRTWPQQWRADRSIMERVCNHGVGHPDPDNPWPAGDRRWSHGCDGCCGAKRHAISDLVAELRYADEADTDPWDRTLYTRAADALDRLICAVDELLAGSDADHQAAWADKDAEAAGERPVGCTRCGPGDGGWPCAPRRALDRVRQVRNS